MKAGLAAERVDDEHGVDCVDTSKGAGDDDYLRVFVSAAEAWMAKHKVEGFAIECPVRGDKGG